MLATWVTGGVYAQNKSYLDGINDIVTGVASTDRALLCRAYFKDGFKSVTDAATLAINELESDKTKHFGLSKSELLTGVVLGGKCVVAYKDPALGTRFPHVAKNYQVLVLQRDYGNIRGQRVAIRHKQSGLCIGDDGKKPVMTSCIQKDTKNKQPAFILTKDGYLATAFQKSKVELEPGKCVLANLGRHGLQWGKCQNNQYVKWFINAKKQLTNSWGRCAEVNKHLQKPGGTIYLLNGCHQKLGQEAEWELVPYVPVKVGHFGPGIEGIVTARELHRHRSPRTICATKGCLGHPASTTSLHLPGEVVKLGISVSKYYTGINAFSHWQGAPCKKTDNPCTFKVDPKKNYRKIAFAMKPLMKPVKLGGLFTVQQGRNCLSIAPKGAKPQMTPCKKDEPRQMFTSTSDGRGGMLRASMMAPVHCIYPASTSVKSKDPVQAPKCGAVSHELPEGAGFPKWVYASTGHIRFAHNTNTCVETKGKALIRVRCEGKTRTRCSSSPRRHNWPAT